MSGHRLFNSMRAGLAPLIRPVLEGVSPVRKAGLWLLSRRHPDKVELEGQIFHVDPRDFGVTLELHSTGTYEPFTRGVCMEALKPGGTFLDIGAHVGLYSLPAARAVGPGGKVIAFEPHPGNRSLLETNLADNGVQNVTVVPAAVSDAPGELDLQVSPFNTGDHRLYRGRGSRGHRVRTEVVSVDAWCAANGVERVDLVKIDVQGAEARVVSGMQSTMATNARLTIILEYTPWMLRKAEEEPLELLVGLADLGFELSILDEGDGSMRPASPEEIHQACPGRSYVNVMATREGGTP